MQVPEIVAERLEPNERVLWIGQPRPGFALGPMFATDLMFSLVWTGGAAFWEYEVADAYLHSARDSASIVLVLWGLPFLAIGLYRLVLSHFVAQLRQKRTFYAVTSLRVIATSEFIRRSFKSHALSAIGRCDHMALRQVGYLGFRHASGEMVPLHFAKLELADMSAAANAVRDAIAPTPAPRAQPASNADAANPTPKAQVAQLVTRWSGRPSNSAGSWVGAILVTLLAIPFAGSTLVFVLGLLLRPSETFTTWLFLLPFALGGVVLVRGAFTSIKGLFIPSQRTLAVDAEAIYWGNLSEREDLNSLRTPEARARKPKLLRGWVVLSEISELHFACGENKRNYLYMRHGKRVHLPDDILRPDQRMDELVRALQAFAPSIALLKGGRSGQWY